MLLQNQNLWLLYLVCPWCLGMQCVCNHWGKKPFLEYTSFSAHCRTRKPKEKPKRRKKPWSQTCNWSQLHAWRWLCPWHANIEEKNTIDDSQMLRKRQWKVPPRSTRPLLPPSMPWRTSRAGPESTTVCLHLFAHADSAREGENDEDESDQNNRRTKNPLNPRRESRICTPAESLQQIAE